MHNVVCAYFHTVAAQEGPGIVIAHPGQDVELLCTVTGAIPSWRVNSVVYTLTDLFNGTLAGHNTTGINIIVEDIMMNDNRNGSVYICLIQQIPPIPDIVSDPITLYVAGEYVCIHYYNYYSVDRVNFMFKKCCGIKI